MKPLSGVLLHFPPDLWLYVYHSFLFFTGLQLLILLFLPQFQGQYLGKCLAAHASTSTQVQCLFTL